MDTGRTEAKGNWLLGAWSPEGQLSPDMQLGACNWTGRGNAEGMVKGILSQTQTSADKFKISPVEVTPLRDIDIERKELD